MFDVYWVTSSVGSVFLSTVNGRVFQKYIKVVKFTQTSGLLVVLLVLIIAFHDKPSVIYTFYVVLNCFKSISSLLVDIEGIIAQYRELLGD